MVFRSVIFVICMWSSAALADAVGVTGQSVYVTKSDCMAMVRHHPSADATYQPGTDVHGHYVAPADLPDGNAAFSLPDKIEFDLKINPLMYGGASRNPQAGKLANTEMPIGRVSVDMKTGQTLLNGKPLEGDQDQFILEVCRKAGFR